MIGEMDGLGVRVDSGCDDPIGRIELGQDRARPEPDELELIAAARKVRYGIAIRLAGTKYEDIIARATGKQVVPRAAGDRIATARAIELVAAAAAGDGVVERVAHARKTRASGGDQVLDICPKRI